MLDSGLLRKAVLFDLDQMFPVDDVVITVETGICNYFPPLFEHP